MKKDFTTQTMMVSTKKRFNKKIDAFLKKNPQKRSEVWDKISKKLELNDV